jgi:GNAT superfamily N-acetyltransferase
VIATWRGSRTVVTTDPFEVYIDEGCAVPWMSLALPVRHGAAPSEAAAGLAGLLTVFHRHERRARFEFFDLLWPRLPAQLEGAGFVRRGEQPLMVWSPDAAADGPAPEEEGPTGVRWLGPSALEARRIVEAQRLAYAATAAAPSVEEEAAALVRDVEQGRSRCAWLERQDVVVSVLTLAGRGAICEVAGVATIPTQRGRGLASALLGAALRDHAAQGGLLAWLSYEEESVGRIYGRLGFRPIDARQLNYDEG